MNKTTTATDITHILWNPNKNYLGSWDLIPHEDLILTIKNISWEEVKNPTTGDSSSKRVVRFIEDVKPMICNEENASAIFKVCDTALIRDYEGKEFKIALYTIRGTWFGQESEAVRVRDTAPKPKIKEVMTDGHKLWEKLGSKVKSGETTIDDVLNHYIISDEDFNSLLK